MNSFHGRKRSYEKKKRNLLTLLAKKKSNKKTRITISALLLYMSIFLVVQVFKVTRSCDVSLITSEARRGLSATLLLK